MQSDQYLLLIPCNLEQNGLLKIVRLDTNWIWNLGVGRRGYKIAVFINRYGKPCILCSRNLEGYPEFCINCTNSHCPAGLEQAVNAPGRVNRMHQSGASKPQILGVSELATGWRPMCTAYPGSPGGHVPWAEGRCNVWTHIAPKKMQSMCTNPTLCQCIPSHLCLIFPLKSCVCSIRTGKITSYIFFQQMQPMWQQRTQTQSHHKRARA